MKARVFVTLKPSVFDPQGHTIVEALHSLGYGDGRRRAAGQVLRARSRTCRRPARRETARGRGRRSRAGQSGDRKLPHRARGAETRGRHDVRRRRVSGIELRPRRVPRGQARARPGRAVRLAQGDVARRRRRRDPARRVLARRLPAHRRHRAVLAGHGGRDASSPRRAARCSASATAFRSCSSAGCCPARCCATAT